MKNNPYESPVDSSVPVGVNATRDSFGLQLVLCAHLGAVIASAFVVHSETVLSDRYLELMIAMPLISTIIVGPIAMMICILKSMRRATLSPFLAMIADLLLSGLQMFIWLPTVQ